MLCKRGEGQWHARNYTLEAMLYLSGHGEILESLAYTYTPKTLIEEAVSDGLLFETLHM